jgi:hypothetical protein
MGKDIIPFPIQPSEKYPRSELQIQTWLAEKNEFANRRRSLIQIKKETEKAYLIEFVSGVPEEHWIPKSVCKIVTWMERGLREF